MKKMKKWMLSILVVLAVLFAVPEGMAGFNTRVEVQAAVTVGTPQLVSVTTSGTSKATVTWKKVSGVSGYRIYRKVDGKGWRTMETVSGSSTVSYTDTKLQPGTCYVYTVRAYKRSSGKTTWGAYDKKGLRAVSGLSTPKFTVKKTTGSKPSAKLTITAVKGAHGYAVYRKTSANGSWSKLGTVTGTTYTDTGVKNGKTYYYTVKAYCTYHGRTYASAYDKKGTACSFSTTVSPFAKLKNLIQKEGYTDSKGDKFIVYTLTEQGVVYEWGIYYRRSTNQLEFVIGSENDGFLGGISMYVKENPSNVNPDFLFIMESDGTGVYASASIKASSYNGQKLSFTIRKNDYDVDYKTCNDLANSMLQLGFAGWEEMLYRELKMSLRDLGFTSYRG